MHQPNLSQYRGSSQSVCGMKTISDMGLYHHKFVLQVLMLIIYMCLSTRLFARQKQFLTV